MRPLNDILIFTDLDGTLLDHETYSYEAAQSAITVLRERNAHIIPVTSKTRAEVMSLRASLELNTPFVVENGAAVFIPKSQFEFNHDSLLDCDEFWCKAFGLPRQQHQDLMSKLSRELQDCCMTFGMLGNKRIAEVTGLSRDHAALANQREYSDPILWQGSDAQKSQLRKEVEGLGYRIQEGGRFLHITNGYDKGKALVWLKQQYICNNANTPFRVIALGDSDNDIDMLEAADQAIVIKNPNKPTLMLPSEINEIRSASAGPKGWAESLSSFLDLDLGEPSL